MVGKIRIYMNDRKDEAQRGSKKKKWEDEEINHQEITNSLGAKARFWAGPCFTVHPIFFDGFTLFRGC